MDILQASILIRGNFEAQQLLMLLLPVLWDVFYFQRAVEQQLL
jgi:hypothetical protein